MVRRTKEEALETRHRILDAAETVFHARGVARPSLADIAQAAGVTRGAIYWHFKNKSDVFAAMCDRVHLPVEALCDPERIARQEDPLGGVRDICAYVMRQTVVNPRLRRVFEIIFHKCEMVQDNGAIFERQRQSHKEGLVKIREHLRLARERGAWVLALTDSIVAPVVAAADEVIVCPCEDVSFVDSLVVPTFAVETIAARLSRELGPQAHERLEGNEALAEESGLFAHSQA